MRFEAPLFLWLAPTAALIVVLLAWLVTSRRIKLAAAWSSRLAPLAKAGRAASVLLLALAAAAAGVGAAGPRGGRIQRSEGAQGLNVLIAVDVSRSMLAEDAEPNRLHRAVREAQRLVQDLPQDRIGIIAFAGQAYLLSPLTLDHSAVRLYLETLDPDLASAGGTQVEPLLRVATQVLTGSREGGDRALIIFTDGEGHDSLELSVNGARALRKEGIRLILAGQGGIEPVRIPLRDATGAVSDYKRDAKGNPVLTMRRDEILQALALAADGVVIPADLPDQAGAIRDQLGALTRRPLRERRLADLAPLAWIAALVAALLLAMQTGTRRGASLAALFLAIALPLSAQEIPRGERLLKQGKAREAAEAYRRDAQAGRGGDTAWYNTGTALVRADEFEASRDVLLRATKSLDPSLRFRAFYNLGLATLQQSRKDTAGRQARETEAIGYFKQALLLDPGSGEAKWNLELLLRPQPPSNNSPKPNPQGQRPQQENSSALSPTQAEAILSSVEQNEAATRQSVVRRQRLRSSASSKDW
jgi:Ca-activated chloride channel family protein